MKLLGLVFIAAAFLFVFTAVAAAGEIRVPSPIATCDGEPDRVRDRLSRPADDATALAGTASDGLMTRNRGAECLCGSGCDGVCDCSGPRAVGTAGTQTQTSAGDGPAAQTQTETKNGQADADRSGGAGQAGGGGSGKGPR